MPIPSFSSSDPDDWQIVVTSAATVTAAIRSWYRIDSTSTVNVPAGPPNGASVRVENTSTSATVTVSRTGSTDTIEGSATLTVPPGDYVDITYRTSDTTYYRRRSGSAATAGTDMRRNAAAQTSVGAATAADHAVNKSQLDAVSLRPATAGLRTGHYLHPSNAVGPGTATAPVSGVVAFMPFLVGTNAPALTALAVNCSTALVGGATVTTLGLYPDDGNGAPLCTGGPLRSGTITLAGTGNRIFTFGSTLAPTMTVYWGAFLYVASTAPTTAPALLYINVALLGPIPTSNGVVGTTYTKGWTLAGQSALPTTDIRSSLSALGNVPVMGLAA